ncbi:hypothetical protein MBLNU13_g05738t2 [Cladosporium sp. NU13]
MCQINFTVDPCHSAIDTSEQKAVRYSQWVRADDTANIITSSDSERTRALADPATSPHQDKVDDTTRITASPDSERARAFAAIATSPRQDRAADTTDTATSAISRRTRALIGLANIDNHQSQQLYHIHTSFQRRNHTVDFDTVYHDDREDVASHLRAYDRSITRNATEVHIYVKDDGNDVNRYTYTALRFTLGRHRVNWSSDSSGASRQGMVHVVFDSLRGSEPVSREHALEIAADSNKWRRHNTKVAKKIASTINNMLASHGPHLPPRITACELVTLIYLLKDIHGIKLDGFGEGLGMRLDWRMDLRHIMHGAATDFWAMVGRE